MTTATVAGPRAVPASARRITGWVPELLLVLSGIAITAIGTSVILQAVLIVAGVIVVVALRVGPVSARPQLAVMASTALVVVVPFKRLDHATPIIFTCAALLVVFGIVGSLERRPPRGTLGIVVLVGLLAVTTVVASDVPSLFRLLPFVVASIPIFWVLGNSTTATRLRAARFVVLLALVETAVAIVEPFLFRSHLWAPAQLDSLGNVVRLMNPLIGSLERSQGTLGHPLALSFLLLIALAIVIRPLAPRRWLPRAALVSFLFVGLAMSGSRNSLLLALILVVFFGVRRVTLTRIVVGSLVVVALVVVGIEVGIVSATLQAEFLDSGSYTHRAGALDAFGRLLVVQQPLALIFGNGAASTDWLFAAGLLQNDNLDAVDNQLVLTMAQGGLVSLALLIGLLVAAAFRSSASIRPVLLASTASMFVFDLFAWPSASLLVFGVLAVALNPSRDPLHPTSEVT